MATTRSPGMSPTVCVELSPAYELLQAINVVTSDDEDHTYEIGEAWVAEARERAGEDLLRRVREVSLDDGDTFTHLAGLVYDTPAPRDVPAFIQHLRETDPDEIRLHLVQFDVRETRRTTAPAVIRAAVAGDPAAREELFGPVADFQAKWVGFIAHRRVLTGPAVARAREIADAVLS